MDLREMLKVPVEGLEDYTKIPIKIFSDTTHIPQATSPSFQLDPSSIKG